MTMPATDTPAPPADLRTIGKALDLIAARIEALTLTLAMCRTGTPRRVYDVIERDGMFHVIGPRSLPDPR